MSFDNMPVLGPMMMPGANEYAAECLRRARLAVAGHRVRMDIPYGPDPFQQLDLWLPPGPAAAPLPVVIFIHGGAMRNGFKDWIGCMAPAVCALPAILVSPNYRLVPRVRNVDALADCLAALAWVHANIAAEGGDPDRLYLGGHSAGGYLAALMTLRKPDLTRHGIAEAAIRACLPVSGLFTFEKRDILPQDVLRTRFWDEMIASEAEAAALTAYNFVAGNRVPFLLAHGEREPADILNDNARMVELARRHGFLREHRVFPGADHFAAHLACAEPDGAWLRAVAGLVRGRS